MKSFLITLILLNSAFAFQFRQYHGLGLSSSDVQNSEVVGRTKDTLLAMIQAAASPVAQLYTASLSGFLNFEDLDVDLTRGMLYSLIRSINPRFSNLYVGLETGDFIGFARNGSGVDFIFGNVNETCSESECRRVFPTNDFGEPVGQGRTEPFSVHARPWYTSVKSSFQTVWTQPYQFAYDGSFGISLAFPLFAPGGAMVFVGVAAIDIKLNSICALLQENRDSHLETVDAVTVFADTTSEGLVHEYKSITTTTTAVTQDSPSHAKALTTTKSVLDALGSLVLYMVDLNTGFLIASSQSTIDELVPAETSALDEISSSYQRVLEGMRLFDNVDDARFVFADHSLLTHKLVDTRGLNWLVVVATDLEAGQKDHIVEGSAPYFSIAFAASVGLTFTAVIFLNILKHRKLKIWTMAQVPLLCLILVGNTVCYAYALLSLGPNTNVRCLARFWTFPVGIVAIGLAFLAKLLRVYRIAVLSKNFRRGTISTRHTVYSFAIPGTILFVILIVSTFVAPASSVAAFQVLDEAANSFVYVTVCSENDVSSGIIFTFMVIILMLGSALSFKMRNFSEMMAESRALGLTVYHTTIVLLVMLGLSVSNLAPVTTTIASACLMMWLSVSVQLLVFGPRLWLQISRGDLTKTQQLEVIHRGYKPSEKHLSVTSQRPSVSVKDQSISTAVPVVPVLKELQE